MTETPNYHWQHLSVGDADYPDAHEALVNEIDEELHRVEQTGGVSGRTVVQTTGELEAAFNQLSDGDHIHVTDANAPYRTSQYLDIDSSDVTVTGQGTRPLVKVADGANVGGIRIGFHSHAQRVTIDGYSHDGNPAGQTMNEGGFGIASFDAEDVTIQNCDIRRTVPHRQHNQMNSGVSVYDETFRFEIVNNHFEDIGDRAIECAGQYGWVAGNTSKHGFDRMICWSAEGSDGYAITIAGNRLDTNTDGSFCGGGAYSNPTGQGRIILIGNIATGHHRRFAHIAESGGATDVIIANNIGRGHESPSEAIECEPDNVSIIGNQFYGYGQRGITCRAPRTHIANNRIEDCGGAAIYVKPNDPNRPAQGDGGKQSVIEGNILSQNNAGPADAAEVVVDDDRVHVTNNHIPVTRDTPCFDNPGGEDSVFAWNVVPPGATLFGEKQSSTVAQGNIN